MNPFSTPTIQKKTVCFWILLLLAVPLRLFAQSDRDINRYRAAIENNGKANRKKADDLLGLGTAMVFKKGEFKADLDSANLLKNQAYRISKTLRYPIGIGKSALLQGQIERERGEIEASRNTILAAASYFEKHRMPEQQADCLLAIAQYYWFTEDGIEKKIAYANQAKSLYEKKEATVNMAKCMQYLGELYAEKNEMQKAEGYLLKALRLYQSKTFAATQAAYGKLAHINYQSGKYPKALKFGLLAEKIALEQGDTSAQLSTIYNILGITYHSLKNYKAAELSFQKGLKIAYANKDVYQIRMLTVNISSVYMANRKYREGIAIIEKMNQHYPADNINDEAQEVYLMVCAYCQLKEPKNAKKYYEQALKIYAESNDDDLKKEYLVHAIIEYLQATGQYDKTYPYLGYLKELSQKSNTLIDKSQVETQYYVTELYQKNYKQALTHLNNYRILNDSLYNIERDQQIAELQVQFETDKKNKDIKLLQSQAALQKTEIEKNTVIKYVFLASLVVLVLFLALLYHRYRFKQKSNEQLQQVQHEVSAQNEMLKNLLTEKEWLLKEIHHRVKNNLQIVISLLNTQSAYLDNEDALMAIRNSQYRMHAMSLIHQKLYQSDNLSTIDFSWYVQELVDYLKDSLDTANRITFRINLLPLELDVSEAVPLGLILNEAVTNAMKYAFPETKNGRIEITIEHSSESGYYCLEIADNGIGLPEDFDSVTRTSLGISLMKGLAKQLEGTFELQNKKGLTVLVTFNKQQKLS